MSTYNFGILQDLTTASSIYYDATPPVDTSILWFNTSNKITFLYDSSSLNQISVDTELLSFESPIDIYSGTFGNTYFFDHKSVIINIKSNISNKLVDIITEDSTVVQFQCPYESNVRLIVPLNKTLKVSTPVEFYNDIPKYISTGKYVQLIIARSN